MCGECHQWKAKQTVLKTKSYVMDHPGWTSFILRNVLFRLGCHWLKYKRDDDNDEMEENDWEQNPAIQDTHLTPEVVEHWTATKWNSLRRCTSFKEIKNCRKIIFEFCFSTFDGKNHKLRIIKIIRQIISWFKMTLGGGRGKIWGRIRSWEEGKNFFLL